MKFKDFLVETADWMIEIERDGRPFFVNIERDGRVSFVPQSPVAFSHCSKWKVKDRALKVLRKMPADARLIQTYGGYVYSGKDRAFHKPTKRSDQ